MSDDPGHGLERGLEFHAPELTSIELQTPQTFSCPTSGVLLDFSQIKGLEGVWIYNGGSTQVQLFTSTGTGTGTAPNDVLIATLYQDDGMWISVPLRMIAQGVGATGSLSAVAVNKQAARG